MLIRDGAIAAIGTTRRIENLKEARTAAEIPVNDSIVMPAFIDPSVDLSLEGGKSPDGQRAPRKRLSTFSSESQAFLRSCLMHGTLTAEIKAHAALDDFRSDFAVLRRLAGLDNPPIEMVRTWRIGQLPDEPQAAVFQQTLSSLTIRRLARFVELSANPDQLVTDALFTIAETSRIPMKLRWEGGPAEVLADVLSRVNPFTIACPSILSDAECAVLGRASSMVVFTPGRDVL
ncbi:MAG: hypothetical protein JOZ22_13735, partial [Acidobacteriia bacterium]|nr:hypothetical protein [Terriglobia bacterium]